MILEKLNINIGNRVEPGGTVSVNFLQNNEMLKCNTLLSTHDFFLNIYSVNMSSYFEYCFLMKMFKKVIYYYLYLLCALLLLVR